MCEKRPHFVIYPSQLAPQDAYIEINAKGEIFSGHKGDVGNALPVDVWNKKRLWFYIQPQLTESEIDALIAEIKEKYLPRFLEISDILWDGSNWRRSPVAPEHEVEYWDLHDKIKQLCDLATNDDFEPCDDENCTYCNFGG